MSSSLIRKDRQISVKTCALRVVKGSRNDIVIMLLCRFVLFNHMQRQERESGMETSTAVPHLGLVLNLITVTC